MHFYPMGFPDHSQFGFHPKGRWDSELPAGVVAESSSVPGRQTDLNSLIMYDVIERCHDAVAVRHPFSLRSRRDNDTILGAELGPAFGFCFSRPDRGPELGSASTGVGDQ
jgi:hypothetical protein